MSKPTPAQLRHLRSWAYRVLLALGPVAVFYGLVTAEEAALWIGVAAAAIGGAGLDSPPSR